MLHSGKCSICGTDRIEIKKDLWVCPLFYGSPMHRCNTYIFECMGMSKEEAQKKVDRILYSYCGLTSTEFETLIGNYYAQSNK